MQRTKIVFTPMENEEFNKLSYGSRLTATRVWDFWKDVAANRDLDYKSLNGMTALPLDHGKHWCWPSPLKLVNRPQFSVEAESPSAAVPRVLP